jgi:hypothetical protein
MQVFLDELSRMKPLFKAWLVETAEELRFTDRGLEIVYRRGDNALLAKLQRSNNWQMLEQAAATAWGPGTAVHLVEGAGGQKTAQPQIASVKLEMVAENPTIQTVLEIFQGRVEKVEEHSSGMRED